jgi:two-component system, NtrC family, sensor kinase
MTCPRCQQDNPSHANFCLACGVHLRSTGESGPSGTPYAELQRALAEALEQQTAAGDILRVISGSHTDVQPVFDVIAQSAARLCAADTSIFRVEGERLVFVAHHGPIAQRHGEFSLPLSRGTVGGRSVLESRTVQVADLQQEDREFSSEAVENARRFGFRTILSVPLLREGIAIGGIQLRRTEVEPFSERQVALLQTFADQAVIAIENVRLFTELGESNRDLTEALDRQTATSEILRVISQSQTDVQPVFDAIVDNAIRLFRGWAVAAMRSDGELLHLIAARGGVPGTEEYLRRQSPWPIQGPLPASRAVARRALIHIPDSESDPTLNQEMRDLARTRGWRSVLAAPMLRDEHPIGAITVTRAEAGPFSSAEVGLLQTFADQAVIAIENARLLMELRTKNSDLTETLEQQTATSEILRVISSSPTDVQPVFDTIVRSVVRLCGGLFSALYQFDGELIHSVAQHNFTPDALAEAHRVFPARPTRALYSGRAILERAIVHVPDSEVDSEHQHRALRRAIGWRSGLFVPMLRKGAPIGVIEVARAEPGPFSDSEIELLKTFADQAVIAIQNVRLFKELEARTGELTQSVEQLTALGEVGRAVSSTLDLETVLTTIVSRAVELSGLDGGVVFEYDEVTEEFVQRVATETAGALAEARRTVRIQKGEGVVGRTALTLEPVQVPDITVPGAHGGRLRDTLIESGVRAVLAVPMVYERRLIGSLGVTRNRPGEFPAETIELLRTFATQSALAIQNARLFQEIEDKSRQLEAASQHKSEFLANMSHELRTPLNAIIGFSEVLNERMFGELNEKQDEYLKDIYASGQHLLSLINDILDLSKVEAGRMELEVADFDLPAAIDNALILVRERASRRGITLGRAIDERVGMVQGDERKVKQALLNLLSNALKFTPEGGRIDVRAAMNDGMAEISVADTGVGIAPEDQEAIFEEFRQVGTADKKVEGTGLGLALSRKFIELHGGRIWVKSQSGEGSTFTFTLPVGHGE